MNDMNNNKLTADKLTAKEKQLLISKRLRETVINDVSSIILQDRQATHGAPEDTFSNIAKLWSVYFGIAITPKQVCIAQGLLKIARSINNPEYRDNYDDLAGYALIADAMVLENELTPDDRECILND